MLRCKAGACRDRGQPEDLQGRIQLCDIITDDIACTSKGKDDHTPLGTQQGLPEGGPWQLVWGVVVGIRKRGQAQSAATCARSPTHCHPGLQ